MLLMSNVPQKIVLSGANPYEHSPFSSEAPRKLFRSRSPLLESCKHSSEGSLDSPYRKLMASATVFHLKLTLMLVVTRLRTRARRRAAVRDRYELHSRRSDPALRLVPAVPKQRHRK